MLVRIAVASTLLVASCSELHLQSRPEVVDGAVEEAVEEVAEPRAFEVHVVDFSEDTERHVSLLPAFEVHDRQSYDFAVRHEPGYPLLFDGNGRRSVMYVGEGEADYDRLLEVATFDEHRAAFEGRALYWSPGLRPGEAREGAVFLARIDRGPNRVDFVAIARVFVARVDDTSLTFHVSLAEPWR